jgi:hypothetical protein
VQALPPPQHLSPLLSSPLLLAPCVLLVLPLPKRLDGAACARALQAAAGACVPGGLAREGGSGAGPQLSVAQLGFAQEGGRVERRCVWGADWAAVVSPSPHDEASAKQVLPWRDRRGPLKEPSARCKDRQPRAPLCVSGWSHGCAVPLLQRPVPVASTRQTSDTLYSNATYQSQTT